MIFLFKLMKREEAKDVFCSFSLRWMDGTHLLFSILLLFYKFCSSLGSQLSTRDSLHFAYYFEARVKKFNADKKMLTYSERDEEDEISKLN